VGPKYSIRGGEPINWDPHALERAGAEVLDDLVEALRQPRDLALRHPLDAELLHQLLDPPRAEQAFVSASPTGCCSRGADPSRSFGTASSIEPTRVSQSRSR